MEALSERIKLMGKVRNVPVEKMAEDLGISRQTLNKWNTGRTEPSGKNLNLLAKYFDVSVEWLAFGAEINNFSNKNWKEISEIRNQSANRIMNYLMQNNKDENIDKIIDELTANFEIK